MNVSFQIPTERSPGHKAPYDIDVFPIWFKDRNFGQNIKIMILDDGIQTDHPDLKDNFVRVS